MMIVLVDYPASTGRGSANVACLERRTIHLAQKKSSSCLGLAVGAEKSCRVFPLLNISDNYRLTSKEQGFQGRKLTWVEGPRHSRGHNGPVSFELGHSRFHIVFKLLVGWDANTSTNKECS
jgi:hypothetical protein